MEPIYLVEIQASQDVLSGIYSVVESFGFATELRVATSGKAFPQITFDHWELMHESPFEQARALQIVQEI